MGDMMKSELKLHRYRDDYRKRVILTYEQVNKNSNKMFTQVIRIRIHGRIALLAYLHDSLDNIILLSIDRRKCPLPKYS